jgi:phosphohistidine swiveling domain-containing protein
MPDWNPAEMIGVIPRPLACSLYRYLITKGIWHEARERMGYRLLPEDTELMTTIIGRPYIDVRHSFNSFLPAELNDAVGERLVRAWLDRLDHHPELHDKVEFEVAQTCMDFTFQEDFNARYPGLFSPEKKDHFRQSLTMLTRRCLNLSQDGTLTKALGEIEKLAVWQKNRNFVATQQSPEEILTAVRELLEEGKTLGTLPFSMIARHAFIAESFLRSAVRRHAISQERVKAFKMSIQTITSQMAVDLESVCSGEMSPEAFMRNYGHLRPGTYDITSLRYVDRENLLSDCVFLKEQRNVQPFEPTAEEAARVQALFEEMGMPEITASNLFEYARRAIAGREYGKFIFTRNISDALEQLAQWGDIFGLTRADVSFLDIETILTRGKGGADAIPGFFELIEKTKMRDQLAHEMKLSYILRSERDVYVVPLHRSAPNFIGSQRVEGSILKIDSTTAAEASLQGKIVCIENADPGFDWIFTKGIKALITKYGGANSHMAIRCTEFGLPAAIGCGEDSFNRIVKAGAVELNCADKILRPILGHA